MNNPRILFITPLPPPVHGSAMVSRYLQESERLREQYQTTFINLSTSRRMDEIGKRSVWKLFRFVGTYVKVCSQLINHRFDVCYLAITCQGIGFLKDAPFVLLCKLFCKKVVVHQHNKGMSRVVHRFPYRGLLPWVYRKVDVILLSWKLYPDVKEVVPQKKVWICPNGIPDMAFRKPKVQSRYPRLLFLSNLVVSKGVYVLLDACQQLKERGHRFVCHLVGGESKEIHRDRFQQEVVNRQLADCVFYVGPQYGEDKERYFQEATLFVQPTFEDCFPLTILEAMQNGLPVVSTEEGAIPDMVIDGETGFVCPRKNVDALVNSIEKLLIDKELCKQMGEKGRLRYKEKYTMEVFEKKFLDILSDILN